MPGPETLRLLASYSERQIREATGVRRDTIRLIRHGKGVKRSTYDKVIRFLGETQASRRGMLKRAQGRIKPLGDCYGLRGNTLLRKTRARKVYVNPTERK